MKVDIFVAGRTPLDEEELQRRRLVTVSPDANRALYVAAAEDLVLQKLLYRDGGDVSDRQWRDVLGVLKVQHDHIDQALMRRWATRLGIDDLVERALIEAGLQDR